MEENDLLVKDLSVNELKEIISSTMEDSFDDFSEDLLAITSNNYLNSIRESREEYLKGEIVNLRDL